MLNPTTRFSLLAAAAFAAALSCGPLIAAPAETEATASTPLVRAEKSLRDLGLKAKDTASEITSYALSLIGVDYKFGGNSPEQGLDCSGLIRYVFQQATGISLPRTAREQARVGESIAVDKLQPGDLVFFNTRRFQFSHVGLYIGDNRFIHAPSTGGSVEVVSLDKQYWQKAFNGARRVIKSIPELGLAMSPAEAAAPLLMAITPNGGTGSAANASPEAAAAASISGPGSALPAAPAAPPGPAAPAAAKAAPIKASAKP